MHFNIIISTDMISSNLINERMNLKNKTLYPNTIIIIFKNFIMNLIRQHGKTRILFRFVSYKTLSILETNQCFPHP